jgi:hypothetical protein
VTLEQLKKLMASGVIFAETPVFLEGADEWKTAGDFVG